MQLLPDRLILKRESPKHFSDPKHTDGAQVSLAKDELDLIQAEAVFRIR